MARETGGEAEADGVVALAGAKVAAAVAAETKAARAKAAKARAAARQAVDRYHQTGQGARRVLSRLDSLADGKRQAFPRQ